MSKVSLIKDVVVPDFAEEAVFLQSTLLQLTDANIEEIVKQLAINFPDPSDEDMDKIASNVYTIVKVRPKAQKTYASLMGTIQLFFNKQFDKDTLLCAPPWFLRHLYLQGLIDIEKVEERCNERSYYKPFFLVELGYDNSVLRGQFNLLGRMYDSLKENDFKKYKEILEFGYAKDTPEYAIKYDDIEYVKAHSSTIRNLSTSPIEFNNFSENDFQRKTPDFWDEAKTTMQPIVFAAHYGSPECFKYFLTNNGRIDLQVIAEACYGGNDEIVKKCIEKTANVGKGKIAALISLRNNVYDMIANMNGETFGDNLSARAGNVLALLNDIKDLKQEPVDGISRMMTAAEFGNYGAIEILYYKGFSLTYTDNCGTCLCRAASSGHIPIVRQLIGYGARYNDGNNRRCLADYICRNNQIAIIKLLMKNGLNINQSDSYMTSYVRQQLFPNFKPQTTSSWKTAKKTTWG